MYAYNAPHNFANGYAAEPYAPIYQPGGFQPQLYPPQYYPAPVHGAEPDPQRGNGGFNFSNLLKKHPLYRMYQIGHGVIEGYHNEGLRGAGEAYLNGMWNFQKQNVQEGIAAAPQLMQAMYNPQGFLAQQLPQLVQQLPQVPQQY